MKKEQLTEKEKKRLRDLQAKQKRIMREDKKFLLEADRRRDELLKRWGLLTLTEKLPGFFREGVQGAAPASQDLTLASNRSELLPDAGEGLQL